LKEKLAFFNVCLDFFRSYPYIHSIETKQTLFQTYSTKRKLIMNTTLKSLFVVAMAASSLAAQAAWDMTVASNNNQYLYAAADSYAADGDLRFSRQMTSNETPDTNGFLYLETIAQFSCTKNAMQVVKATGFKTWDDNGQSVDSMLGAWRDIKNGSNEQVMLNKLCNTSVADASKFSN
jgi:hypothetical protein